MAVEDTDSICFHENTLNITENESEDLFWSQSDKYVITIFIPLLVFIGISANGIFLYTVARIPDMHTHANIFLTSLAIIDIIILLYAIIINTSLYITSELKVNFQYFQTSVGCICFYFFGYTLTYGETFNVTLVALEQFFAVCHPLRNRVNRIRNFKILAVIGLLAAIISGSLRTMSRSKIQVLCLIWPNELGQLRTNVYKTCVSASRGWSIFGELYPLSVYTILLIVNTLAYYKIIKKINSRPINENNLQAMAKSRQACLQKQVARMLAIHAVVFFLSYFFSRVVNPVVTLMSVFGIEYFSRKQASSLDTISRTLLLVNSAANPFIYGVSSQQYREAFFKAFRRSASGSFKLTKIIDKNTENPREDTNCRFKFGESTMTSVL